jgi:hypothetical protein
MQPSRSPAQPPLKVRPERRQVVLHGCGPGAGVGHAERLARVVAPGETPAATAVQLRAFAPIAPISPADASMTSPRLKLNGVPGYVAEAGCVRTIRGIPPPQLLSAWFKSPRSSRSSRTSGRYWAARSSSPQRRRGVPMPSRWYAASTRTGIPARHSLMGDETVGRRAPSSAAAPWASGIRAAGCQRMRFARLAMQVATSRDCWPWRCNCRTW